MGLLLVLVMAAAMLPAGALADADVCTESPDGQHHWEYFNYADCTSGGAKFKQCTYCYEYRDEVWVDALGHDWSGWAVRQEATCDRGGTEYRSCSRCGETETRETPALGHSWNGGAVTARPGCTSEGVRTFTCTRCGATRTESIPAAGHRAVSIPAVAATCTSGGKTEGSKCSVCGAILTAPSDTGAMGHSWDEGTVTKEAGYLEDGQMLYTCTRDPSHTRTEVIPATIGNDSSSISTFMGKVRSDPPKEPSAFDDWDLNIVQDPQSGIIPEGGTYELSVEASGGIPPYRYYWHKVYELKGETFDDLIGENSPTCPVTETGTYYCIVGDKKGAVFSHKAEVYTELRITEQPQNANFNENDSVTVAAVGGNGNYIYKWYGGWGTEMAGLIMTSTEPDFEATNAKYLLQPGMIVYCVVSDTSEIQEVTSNTALLYSAETLTVSCTPQLLLREGEKAELGAWVSGGVEPYDVVWYSNTTPMETVTKPDGGVYITVVSNGGYSSFRCEVTDKMGRKAKGISGYDYRGLTIIEQPQDGKLTKDGSCMLNMTVSDGKAPYKFELYNPNGDNVILETELSQCQFSVTEGGWYYIYAEDADGVYAWSDFAVIEDYERITLVDYTADVDIMKPKGYATLSVTVTGGREPYSYHWTKTEHGPYDPSIFHEETLWNMPSVDAYEPGAVYSCKIYDADGDYVVAENIRVGYAGGIWILEQPQGVVLPYDESDHYSFSLDTLAISGPSGKDLQTKWYVTSGGGKKVPYTGQGGSHFRREGNAEQISTNYICEFYEPFTGERVLSDPAPVYVELTYIETVEVMAEDKEYEPQISVRFFFKGGLPPYTIYVNGDMPHEKLDYAKSVSPYQDWFYRYKNVKANGGWSYRAVTYHITVEDAMKNSVSIDYTPTLYSNGEGIPARITLVTD